MFNTIIKGIFWLITTLYTILLSPILITLQALIPNLTTVFQKITQFLSMSFTYVRSILSLLLIPDVLVTFYFDFYVLTLTAFTISITVYFAFNIYNKFKP